MALNPILEYLTEDGVLDRYGSLDRAWFETSLANSRTAIAFAHQEWEQYVREGYGDETRPA